MKYNKGSHVQGALGEKKIDPKSKGTWEIKLQLVSVLNLAG